MKKLSKQNELFAQLRCCGIFVVMMMPMIIVITVLYKNEKTIFSVILFLTGWFTWTFVEYCLHRFWNHAKHVDKENPIVRIHHYHHTHPREIKVSKRNRIFFMLISFVLIIISVFVLPWLMLAGGFFTGIFWFFLMHYFLHQNWAKKVFPKQLHYHIIHHCKEPDRCFGISFTWWDHIFNTVPSRHVKISDRVIGFYFGEKTLAY